MKATSLQTTQLIFDALRPDQTPDRWEFSFKNIHADWNDLAVRAIVFGLAPQLHYRLSKWGIQPPSSAFGKLAVTFAAHEKRNQAIAAQLAEVVTFCHARGLHPVALKGVHLAQTVYEVPALRPMNDIDLLFPADELLEAERVLSELGYGGKHKDPTLGPGITKHTSTYRREGQEGATSNPYLSAEAGRMVEPHVSLEESWFGLTVDITPGVHQRAEQVSLGGTMCRTLAVEDLFLHLYVHFCFHLIMGAPSMVQLTDLLKVAQNLPFDASKFVDRVHSAGAAPYAYAGMTVSKTLLSAPIPEDVRQKVGEAVPSALRSQIDQLGLEDILARTQKKPLNTFVDRLRRGLEDRAETAGWAVGWTNKLRVWSTALTFWKTDTGLLLAGKETKT